MNWLTPLDITTAALPPSPPPTPKPQAPDPVVRKAGARRAPNGAGFVRKLPDGQQVKRCAGCQVDHDVSEFPKGTGPGDLHRYCRAYQRVWRRDRKERGAA